jgi:hypothetical protein
MDVHILNLAKLYTNEKIEKYLYPFIHCNSKYTLYLSRGIVTWEVLREKNEKANTDNFGSNCSTYDFGYFALEVLREKNEKANTDNFGSNCSTYDFGYYAFNGFRC